MQLITDMLELKTIIPNLYLVNIGTDEDPKFVPQLVQGDSRKQFPPNIC